jgi:hypothetical protein
MKLRISILNIAVVLIKVVILRLRCNRFRLFKVLHILDDIITDPEHINLGGLWLLDDDRPVPLLMVGLGINTSGRQQVLIELDLWLVNTFCKSVRLFSNLIEKLVVAPICLLARNCLNWGLPPWVPLDLIPVDPVDRILLKHLLDQVVELLRELGDHWYFLDNDLLY